jgi:hypothetical protein
VQIIVLTTKIMFTSTAQVKQVFCSFCFVKAFTVLVSVKSEERRGMPANFTPNIHHHGILENQTFLFVFFGALSGATTFF